jgi:hypothetical protein
MMSQVEIEEFLYKYKSTNMIFVNDKDKMKYNRILLENIDLKNRLDKIKENNQRIIDYGFDYDAFNNVEDLKRLIDMLVDYANKNKELLEEIK